MGIKNILKKILSKDRKIVITGLDNAGKTTMVSFLQTGTFIEHTPTMGKEETTLEVQGIRINIVDMGGQKDFRSLWTGELKDAAFVIFMVDATDKERFDEAKKELWKLSSLLKDKPLLVLANKYDLQDTASIKEIMDSLELEKLSSFQIVPISCKTGFGIVKSFKKVYYKLTGKELIASIKPKAVTIFDKGGIPLSSTTSDDVLKGGLFSAITNFIKESFNSELNQLKMEGNTIIFKRSENLLGSIIIDDADELKVKEAEDGLAELLNHLENICVELNKGEINEDKIKYLVEQYSSNLMD
ncbi:MAG: GTP-binding protein [Candidatus Lokiarchaeota archaeon]|nr:GTP-binding protein [Candidatus Lokiarchaeota archaeon]MBD3342120.1 GTP-binding protein [Candidatus Lokiarchaeota archaeon]